MKNEPLTAQSLKQVLPAIQEELSQGFSVTLYPQGTSMEPMLYQGRDSVVLSPVRDIKKNDVILYQRTNGQFVLHRVIGIKNGAYVLRGDNQFIKEYPVYSHQVIAVVSAFTRNRQYTEINDRKYRFYCMMWPVVHPFVRVRRMIRNRIGI